MLTSIALRRFYGPMTALSTAPVVQPIRREVHSMPKEQGLDAQEIDQETAVALPERDAMSLVDGGTKLVPIATIAPEPQINPDPNAAPIVPPPNSE